MKHLTTLALFAAGSLAAASLNAQQTMQQPQTGYKREVPDSLVARRRSVKTQRAPLRSNAFRARSRHWSSRTSMGG